MIGIGRRVSRFLAVGAMAVGIAIAGSAGADDHTSGEAEVTAKNVRERTVTIGDHTYQVNGRTILTDADGNRIRLKRLPVAAADGDEGDGQMAWARFEATEVRGQLVLNRLELMELPE